MAAFDRETIGFEVVVRFFAGAEREAFEFYNALDQPDQAVWARLDRIVIPDGEDRIRESVRTRA